MYLDLPEGLGAGGRGGRLAQRGPEEDVLLLLVVVTGQKLFLLGMKQPHHVSLIEAKASAFRLLKSTTSSSEDMNTECSAATCS